MKMNAQLMGVSVRMLSAVAVSSAVLTPAWRYMAVMAARLLSIICMNVPWSRNLKYRYCTMANTSDA